MLISQLSEDARLRIGKRLREALELSDVTQDCAAAELKVDPRTIRNMLAGKSLKLARIKDFCKFLDVEFSEIEKAARDDPQVSDNKSLDYGGYTFSSVERYIGEYISIRSSLDDNNKLYCSSFSLTWSTERGGLFFSEYGQFPSQNSENRSYNQGGIVHISPDIGLLHLLTSWRGAVRLITLSRLRFRSQRMFGAILTQADQRVGFVPAISPIVFQKLRDDDAAVKELQVGPISETHPMYPKWCDALRIAERDYIIACNSQKLRMNGGEVVSINSHRGRLDD